MFYVAKHQNINHVANFSTSYLCVLLLVKCCNRKSYRLRYIVLALPNVVKMGNYTVILPGRSAAN